MLTNEQISHFKKELNDEKNHWNPSFKAIKKEVWKVQMPEIQWVSFPCMTTIQLIWALNFMNVKRILL